MNDASRVNHLSHVQDVKQVWYADDSSAAGRLTSLRCWWDNLCSTRPAFGYHANARKTWLITKEHHLSQTKEIFKVVVNITSQGRPYNYRCCLGLRRILWKFVTSKVTEWNEELLQLAHAADTQPPCYLCCLHSWICHKFTYLSRTTPYEDSRLQHPWKIP